MTETNGSLDAAIARVNSELPGWMWRVASCSVSDDAWVCPDFNDPVHGASWAKAFSTIEGDPTAYILERTDIDQRPSGNPADALNKSIDVGLELVRQFSAGLGSKPDDVASDVWEQAKRECALVLAPHSPAFFPMVRAMARFGKPTS